MVHLLGPTTSSLTLVCAPHHLRQDGGTEPSRPAAAYTPRQANTTISRPTLSSASCSSVHCACDGERETGMSRSPRLSASGSSGSNDEMPCGFALRSTTRRGPRGHRQDGRGRRQAGRDDGAPCPAHLSDLAVISDGQMLRRTSPLLLSPGIAIRPIEVMRHASGNMAAVVVVKGSVAPVCCSGEKIATNAISFGSRHRDAASRVRHRLGDFRRGARHRSAFGAATASPLYDACGKQDHHLPARRGHPRDRW